MGKLLHMEGDTIVHEINLSEQVFTIGRALHCNLSIDDPHISQHHTQIIPEKDELDGKVSYRLKDLYSTNGTYVNDKRIDAVQLKDHDIVCIGSARFTFCKMQAS